jgi:hypothetical protein
MTVLPDEVPEAGLDLSQHYMDNRRLLYLLLSLWVIWVFVRLIDLFEAATRTNASSWELAAMFPWQTVPLLLIFGIMAWSRNRLLQLLGVIATFVLVNSAMVNRSVEVAAS